MVLPHLDKVRGLGDLAVPHIRAVNAEQSVVGPDPSVHGGDGVLQDLHDEDAGLWAAPTDPDAEVLARLERKWNYSLLTGSVNSDLALQRHAEHLLVAADAGQGGAPGPWPPVLLNPLPVHSEPQH